MKRSASLHPYEAAVKATIARHRLIEPGARVIVALSGGADSVALLAALSALGYECIAAHCNFHLRGEESQRDMRLARETAIKLGCDFCMHDFDVAARCKQTGESIEMACRELRYPWFHSLLEANYARAIAVGHHREDSAETFMLNLMRGSGIAGLAGIPYRSGLVVRPALDTSRQMIEDYLRHRGLEYVTDSSNLSTDYARNAVRLRLLPLMEELRPGALDAVVRSINALADCRSFVEDEAADLLATAYDPADRRRIDLNKFSERRHGRLLLYEALRRQGFNITQTDDMLRACADGSSGLRFESAVGIVAELDRGWLSFNAESEAAPDVCHTVNLTSDIAEPVRILITRCAVAGFRPENDPNVMYLDIRALQGEPVWQLRRWRRGDRIEPFGMPRGSKLVSDVMAECRLSAAQKRRVWLLTRNGRVVWVIGLRAWRHYTVGPTSTTYLRLQADPSVD